MVLMIVRQKAGPVAWWPKTLKRELENKSRQPRDLTRKRHSDSLTEEFTHFFLWEDEEERC
jgi:hypothetical protein